MIITKIRLLYNWMEKSVIAGNFDVTCRLTNKYSQLSLVEIRVKFEL